MSEPVTPASSTFPPGISGSSASKNKGRPDSPSQSPLSITTSANHASQPAPSNDRSASGSYSKDHGPLSPGADIVVDDEPFDVRQTVEVLTLQFLSDHAETRIAALEWLLMLHLKAPNKVSPQRCWFIAFTDKIRSSQGTAVLSPLC